MEAQDLLEQGGFRVAGASAWIGEHSFTSKVGTGRPNPDDLAFVRDFAAKAARKLQSGEKQPPVIKGNRPYKPFGPSAALRLVTSEACNRCGICASDCPAGCIDTQNPSVMKEGCIRCCACIKVCPLHARAFEGEYYTKSVGMLEGNFTARREAEIFL